MCTCENTPSSAQNVLEGLHTAAWPTCNHVASSPDPIFIYKLAGTKNRAWYPLSRSWCACASHSPESGDLCTVVIWFVILSIYLV